MTETDRDLFTGRGLILALLFGLASWAVVIYAVGWLVEWLS
jgi:hypothetical protein